MHVEALYPVHPVLKQYIEYYYFVQTDDPNFEAIYYAYPHTFNSLNIHKCADYEIHDHFKKEFENPKKPYLSLVQGRYNIPILVHLSGKLDKLTIVFRPLGINQFIRKPFDAVAPHPFQVFREWDAASGYPDFLTHFYATSDNVKRIDLLEAFLMTQYRPLPENELLQEIIEELTDFDRDEKISAIAKNHFIEDRTFTRFFTKHLGLSPVSFKKIARFRHSLKDKFSYSRLMNLTQVGYQSNFYDQSYFVRVYKQMTNENPSSFLGHINKLTDRLFFRFVKDNI